jgi:hypothetical protein
MVVTVKLFPLNLPFICSNIPAAPAYGVYISQLMRFYGACGSYQDFLAANKEPTEPRVPIEIEGQTTQWSKVKGQTTIYKTYK